jgi:hypothetical protein
MPQNFRDLFQLLQANCRRVHQIVPQPFPSKLFSIHYSVIILSFKTTGPIILVLLMPLITKK